LETFRPITSVDLHTPSNEKHDGGGFKSDLNLLLVLRKDGTKQVWRIHIRKDWAERVEIQKISGQFDGRRELMVRYCHAVPLKELVA
jgi:hypothetical protein